MTDLAPIAIFAFMRPDHTKRMLESLHQCPEFASSPVTIYCDAPRKPEDEALVAQTRDVVKQLAPEHAKLVMRDKNMGLANSIIEGVTNACDEHGRVIVVEDDLVFSPLGLGYFNQALEHYKDEDRVMHIAGYMFPTAKRGLPDSFLYREATCWGWATWGRAWKHFEPDVAKILSWIDDNNAYDAVDVAGNRFFYNMIKKQGEGKLDSWAVRWYGSMRMRGGLALHPKEALVANEGHDGTGVHCASSAVYDVQLWDRLPKSYPTDISEHRRAVKAMRDFRLSVGAKAPLWRRITRRIRRALKEAL